jgi:DNA-binding Lrp family transcriptional regulator
MILDQFDHKILQALQRNGALTNAELSELVNLSPSQCSRRRAALEASGVIEGYQARLSARELGFTIRAIVRVNLRMHGQDTDKEFSRWVERQAEVQSAFSVSGDADYVLDVRVRDLESFSDFIHERLLIQPQVAQVRSDFVLKTLKDRLELDLSTNVRG